MEIKKKHFFIILFFVFQVALFANNINPEGYDILPIEFENKNDCNLVSEKIYIDVSQNRVIKTYEIKCTKIEEIKSYIHFTTNPESGYCTNNPYPMDFSININNKVINYSYYNDGKEIIDMNSDEINRKYDINNYLYFLFPAVKGKNTIVLMYTIDINASIIHYNTTLPRDINFKSFLIINMQDSNSFIDSIKDCKKDSFSYSWFKKENQKIPSKVLKISKKSDIIVLSNIENSPYSDIKLNLGMFIDGGDAHGFYFGIYSDSKSIGNCDYDVDYQKALLEKRNLLFMTPFQLKVLRNGFYACHGYNFKNEELRKLYINPFSGMYEVNPNFLESDFNEIERKNIQTIRLMENLCEEMFLSDYIIERTKNFSY